VSQVKFRLASGNQGKARPKTRESDRQAFSDASPASGNENALVLKTVCRNDFNPFCLTSLTKDGPRLKRVTPK
jgi:hypothetical protein